MDAQRRSEIEASFRKQADACGQMGSVIYRDLLARCADDLLAGGVVARLVDGWQGHPVLDALPIRLLGAAHLLALRGDAPDLAALLPSTGGRYEAGAAWRALHALFEAHAPEVRARLGEQIQTNEVRRCCALLGGFLALARAFPWPLRLLEIGASAGLNQCFDQYRYELGSARFGPAGAELALDSEWRGAPLDPDAPLRVASRAGCDLAPIDVRDATQRLRLASFFWPDQVDRLARLRAACAVAARVAPRIERARAGDWLERELAAPAPGRTTVLFHSVMWWYVPEEERARIDALVRAAGERAGPEAPLAWLRMEPAGYDLCEVKLLAWPGGDDRLLGRAHPHAAWVEWLA
jgi:hypothetical protein